MSGQQGTPMIRPITILFLLAISAAPAAAQNIGSSSEWRLREVNIQTEERQLPALEVGGYGRIGIGMFGLKSAIPRSRAVIGHEVSAPKQRRAGVGFSMKF